MHKVWILFIFLGVLVGESYGKIMIEDKNLGYFSGRISKLNMSAGIVRFKVDFANSKYLNKKDTVEFWDMRSRKIRCKAYIIGKSNEYILVKVPDFSFCNRRLYFSKGAYISFFSQDLINNIKMGTELNGILQKKRIAVEGRLIRKKRELDAYAEKVNAVNDRYAVLREKLEAEWRDELRNLEEDKMITLQSYKDLQKRVDNIKFKLEKYKVEKDNFHLDRWALDPRLHFKK